MVDVDICILNHLKEELAWAVDKWLQVISTIIKTSGSESRPRKVELASAHKKTRRLPQVFYT